MDYQNIREWIFKLDPENAHTVVEFLLKNIGDISLIQDYLKRHFTIEDQRLKQKLFDKEFPNPVGLAAGFDKNALMIKSLCSLGFGFVEVGTVTPKPQVGNPKPRLFRYPKYESIQNAMGFNNDGAKEIKKRVEKIYPYEIPIGVNIGKNKTTPEDEAIEDYKSLMEIFKDICDFMVINISSPNTPGLRDLQNENFIKELFKETKKITKKSILLKIAPDMQKDKAVMLCESAIQNGADGIIATNTTMDYSLLEGAKDFGGLSGKVLKEKSFELFEHLAKNFYGKTTLISVGGIDNAEEAFKRLKAGASLVEVFTALIFKGPSLVKEINKGILSLMEKEGFKDINEVIGSDRV